jgi:hypothetical protein
MTLIPPVLIDKFLDFNQPMESAPDRFSTLVFLLKSGRKLSGRDLTTGAYVGSEFNHQNFIDGTYYSFQFSGLISYLILLEQVGSIFKPTQELATKEMPIKKALKYFSDIDPAKIDSIVALRNSMAHKFGLATEKKPHKMTPQKFTLSIERNVNIVQLPIVPWDGIFSNKSEDSHTLIYIHDLIDLIEGVFQKLLTEHKNGNIEVVLEDGLEELKARYTTIN